MKKFFLLFLIFFIFSCKEKVENFQKDKVKKEEKSKVIEIKEKISEKDPLLEAMELLTEYKKDPTNNQLKLSVCEAFSKLAESALKKRNYEMAKNYSEISSICSDEKLEDIQASGEILSKEDTFPIEISLSNLDVQISGISKAKQANIVLSVLDSAYMEILSELSVKIENKIKVVLYTDKEFYDLTGFPPWIGGAYDGRIHLPLANANPDDEIFKKVIKHELTHAILHQATKGRCPTWLHEGLAQYFEGEKIQKKQEILNALENNEIPSINSPSFLLVEKEKSIILYQLSLIAIDYLKNRSSIGTISNFLNKLGEDLNIEDLFYESFLFPYDDLTNRIKEYLKNAK